MVVPSCAPPAGKELRLPLVCWQPVLGLGWEHWGGSSGAGGALQGLSTAGIVQCNLPYPKICRLWRVWL